MGSLLMHVLRGGAVGLANIIPGVSGGTMLLLLGIYERVIHAIHNLGFGTIKAVFSGRQRFLKEMKRIDAVFLACVALGAGVAVVATAKLMLYLLDHQHDPTYGFFFGLVLVSVWTPFRMIKRSSVGVVLSCLVGIVLVVGLTFALSPEQRIASERQKAELKQARAQATTAGEGLQETEIEPGQAILFFLAGMIAIAAMILPGISGSFVLLLLGIYFELLAAILERNLLLLGIFALGCGVGLLACTRLLNWLLARVHDQTMAFLMGLVLGSLWAIWPFKDFTRVGGKRIDTINLFPTHFGTKEILTLLAALLGCGIVLVFNCFERYKRTNQRSEDREQRSERTIDATRLTSDLLTSDL
jgi:putative membrane protein